MFSMCSELTPRARIPDTRIPQFMQPCGGGDVGDNVDVNVGNDVDVDVDVGHLGQGSSLVQ